LESYKLGCVQLILEMKRFVNFLEFGIPGKSFFQRNMIIFCHRDPEITEKDVFDRGIIILTSLE
jgi:hypothetical protein